ncbi:MAG: gamma-glutamyltransferase [Candidatus Dadabacteria bacterium]|nr:gamma-glutamyltransferase [Candidatus Dadabacteria bacterium]MYC40886.1 gamma-glutamyltransferase [Candidatus Dadabacteria bacterium]
MPADSILKHTVALLLVLSILVTSARAEPGSSSRDTAEPASLRNGMIVSEERVATLVGLSVLKEGGNAVDAAVAMGFALAVTYPRAGNLGGGGFMLVHLGKTGRTVAIDYREKAPLKATRNMFLDEKREVNIERARHSVYSSGVPGTVAGLSLALEKYGTMPLEKVIAPAIRLAEEGFAVSAELRESLLGAKERMKKSAESMDVFFRKDGEPPREGEILRQKNLAWSLKQISRNGPQAFYRGAIAKKITAYMKNKGGLITKMDLASYEAVAREPVTGNYRGYKIYSMPPPSSGGVLLIGMLNILEHYPLQQYGHNSARYVHVLSETMKLAYADRSEYLGDPDFSPVPTEQLISKQYAKRLANRINPEKATPSRYVKPGSPVSVQDANTTHFTVADRFGNVVSNTYTLNFSYGSGLAVPETGILLNNEMDDFSAKPGAPNAYGLTGGEKNSIAPGKRMLSSMTPTIVLKDGELFLATGSPGGSRIITSVLQVILNMIDHKMNIREATSAPRVHHQWFPDILYVEKEAGENLAAELRKKGYEAKRTGPIGRTQSVSRVNGVFHGAADPRHPGGLARGY